MLSVLRLLREDIREVVDSMELVKPWDEGQAESRGHVRTERTHVLTYSRTERTDVPTYSTITMGRSYVFKYTVPTVR